MKYIAGNDRGEVLLLPEALEDYIAPENPVRFIDAFVGGARSFFRARQARKFQDQEERFTLAILGVLFLIVVCKIFHA